MSSLKVDHDVAVIGGGPAGSSMAAYLAKSGVDCVVFEGDRFPRPHVGESLVPASTRVFKELDFLDKMEEAGFVHKFGAVWTSAASAHKYDHGWEGLEPDTRVDIRFDERPQPGVDKNYTYHVDRGKFDLLLLEHAQSLGVTVYQGVNVKRVDFADDAPPIVHYAVGERKQQARVHFVVDASGRRTFLGNQLKLKMKDPVFDQYAVHTWFEGFDRRAVAGPKDNYIYIHFLPVTNTWLWQIPITETVTSIGVVTQKKHFTQAKASLDQFFWGCVASRPEMFEELRRAERIRPFTPEGDYSYAMREICGDGFVLIGDAARFVDPIFSSGVSIALNAARFASQDILAALESGDFSKGAFERYETLQKNGMRNWYEFITLYYRLNVLFTAFVRDPRYRLDVLKLLQGDVYEDQEPEVLGVMRGIVTEVENNSKHLWHSLLGDLTANAYKVAFQA